MGIARFLAAFLMMAMTAIPTAEPVTPARASEVALALARGPVAIATFTDAELSAAMHQTAFGVGARRRDHDLATLYRLCGDLGDLGPEDRPQAEAIIARPGSHGKPGRISPGSQDK